MPGNSSKMGQGLDNILVVPRSGLGLSPYEMYRVPTLLMQEENKQVYNTLVNC